MRAVRIRDINRFKLMHMHSQCLCECICICLCIRNVYANAYCGCCTGVSMTLAFLGPATVVHSQCLMQMQNCRMAYWGWGWGVDATPHPQPQLCLQCLMHCKHCVCNVLCIAMYCNVLCIAIHCNVLGIANTSPHPKA